MFEKKSLEEQAKMSKEELQVYKDAESAHAAKVMTDLEEKMQKKLDELQEKFDDLKPEDQTKAIEEMEKEHNEALEKIEGQLSDIKGQLANGIDGKGKSIEEVLEARKDEFNKFLKSGNGSFKIEVTDDVMAVKATQNPSDIDTGTDFATMLPGVGQIPRKRRYMKDIFTIQNVNSEYVKYIDQETVVRDAKNVVHCVASTSTTKLTWKTRTIQIEKVRDFIDVCIDMLDDYAFVEGEVRELITSSIELRVDSQITTGDNISPNLNSVDNISATFSASSAGADYAGAVEAAQLIDLIIVVAAQISAFGSENSWAGDTCLLNPRDFTLLKLLKDLNDNYIATNTVWNRLTPSPGGGRALMLDNSIELIPNPNVTANEMYVFDSSRGKILMRKGAIVEFSFENATNFETETVTIKAYERLNFHVRNVDVNAFIHVPSINAALAALETT